MILRLLISSLALASLVTLSACAGGSNDTASPAQTNQPATSPAQSPAPGQTNQPAPSPAQSPAPGQTNQPASSPAQSPAPANQPAPAITPGQAFLTDLTLSGVSATLTAPSPASGGQEQVAVVQDPVNVRDEFTALNTIWRDKSVTVSLAQTGSATNEIDATNMRVTNLFTGAGIINTEAARFGDVLAGESGPVTVTAQYNLVGTPGVSSVGEAQMTLRNNMTNEVKGISVELPGSDQPQGTLSVTVHFNAGDTGSLNYGVSLRSEGTIVAASPPMTTP